MSAWIPVPETGHSTIRFSLFQEMDTSETTIGHRKLVPTYTERLVWGNGDGRGLEAVPTSNGAWVD